MFRKAVPQDCIYYKDYICGYNTKRSTERQTEKGLLFCSVDGSKV